MSPWFKSLLPLPTPEFWEAIHAPLRAMETPPLTVAELKRAWALHPIQPQTGWIIDHPQWVEDWLHHGPAGQDTFWRQIAARQPDLLWGGTEAQIEAWAGMASEELEAWGGATLLTWVELAQAHPHPEQVSPWLRGVWVNAALHEGIADTATQETRIPMALATIQPWLALGIRRHGHAEVFDEAYPPELRAWTIAGERAARLAERAPTVHTPRQRRRV